jgi:hypothetical protein
MAAGRRARLHRQSRTPDQTCSECHPTKISCGRRIDKRNKGLLLLQALAGGIGGRGARILGEHRFQRTLGAGRVAHFLLAGRDGQPGIRRLGLSAYLVVTTLCALDGALAVALGVPGVAQPVLGIGCQRTVRVFLDEGAKTAGCFLVLAGLELVQCGFVVLRFLAGSAAGLEFAPPGRP